VATNTTTTYTYTLTASNSGGTVTKTAPVTVTVAPALAAPVINSFTATPSSIASGQSSTLAWNLGGGGAASVTINNASVAGTSMKVTPNSTTTYTLTVSNSAGSVTRSVPVTVTPGITPPDQLPSFSTPTQITNPYFPLATLERQILQGRTKGGHTVRVERTLLDRTERFKIGEQTVETLIMQDRSFVDGVLEEVALDYFAQADDGTVYDFGKDVNLYSDGEVVSHEGAWRYGVDTHQLGVIMPAHPEVGTTFQAENVPGITTEDNEVLSVSETVKVRAGRFRNCLLIQETLSDLSVEHKYYAPNVGVIREVTPDGELNLLSLGEGGPRPRGQETFRGPRSREHEE
jgi:hypothetical protein